MPYDLLRYSLREVILPMKPVTLCPHLSQSPQHAPIEMKAPRDAELLYELGPEL